MLLAIETASEIGGVALVEGERLLGERALGPARSHAPILLEAVDALLAEQGATPAALEAIALSVGPGSFTGLRVGLSTALGLCFGTDLAIVPVPTLAALSLGAREAQSDPAARIAPLLDARKGQLYAGLYGPGGTALVADAVIDPAPWLRSLPRGPIWLLGPGADAYRAQLETHLGAAARWVEAAEGEPRAAWVGQLGARLLSSGGARPPDRVRLEYLRTAEAEARRALDTPEPSS